MTRIILTALMGLAVAVVFAQNTTPNSTKRSIDTVKQHTSNIGMERGDDEDWGNHQHHHSSSGFHAGLTFTRFDLGLATLVDNGSFTLSPKNQFLDYRSWKTSTVGFDVIQFGYRFTDNFKINLSGGFDWTLIRLEKNGT